MKCIVRGCRKQAIVFEKDRQWCVEHYKMMQSVLSLLRGQASENFDKDMEM